MVILIIRIIRIKLALLKEQVSALLQAQGLLPRVCLSKASVRDCLQDILIIDLSSEK